jgi:dinuclear metal center YbgI/SA1388 family protein
MNCASSAFFFGRGGIASAAYGAIPYGATVADRDAIIAYLDELLDAAAWQDYGPNGLQVPGAREVTKVVTAVSAHQALFERAAATGAELVLAHHGIFWGGPLGPIDVQMKRRLKTLFDADLSLAAYHLPLDGHPEHGNNALICTELGFTRAEPFATHGGRPIGWTGRVDPAITIDELLGRCARVFGRDDVLHFPGGPAEVSSIGIVSGGGAKDLHEAAAGGLDAFLTGEPSEPAMADARELGIHFLAAGHWATETFGIRRLGELVADRFGVGQEFIALENPV